MIRFYKYRNRVKVIDELQSLREKTRQANGGGNTMLEEIDNRIQALQDEIQKEPYNFDRKKNYSFQTFLK